MKVFISSFLILGLAQTIFGGLVEDLQSSGLTTLLKFVTDAGLGGALLNSEPLTLFAPTNEAFAKLPQETVDALVANPDLLKKVLLYHVIPNAAIKSTDLKPDQSVNTAADIPLRVNVYTKYYHRYPYTTVTANGKKVVKPNVPAGAGSVVHIIDEVITLPEDNIATALTAKGNFKTLLAAVTAADLASTLANGDGPFTVFAPTDEAFAKIDPAAIQDLLKPENKDSLTAILKRHVVAGAVFANGLSSYQKVDTLGEQITVTSCHKGVQVFSSSGHGKVVEADIVAQNGVIHAIDTVI